MECIILINEFNGDFAFLSNFFNSPFEHEGIVYPTNEHFFQAMKTLDRDKRVQIAAALTPGLAKRMGRTLHLRPDWEDIKEDVMLQGLRLKFSKRRLKEMLLNTGDEELIEGNLWYDNTWGSCNCAECKGKGKNLLGQLLMKVREELRNG